MTTLTDTDIDQRFEELETQFRDQQPGYVPATAPYIRTLADIEVPAGIRTVLDEGSVRYVTTKGRGWFYLRCCECDLPVLRCGHDGCELRDPCAECVDAELCVMCSTWCRTGTELCGECDWCRLRNDPAMQQIHRQQVAIVAETRFASLRYEQGLIDNGSRGGAPRVARSDTDIDAAVVAAIHGQPGIQARQLRERLDDIDNQAVTASVKRLIDAGVIFRTERDGSPERVGKNTAKLHYVTD